MRWLPLLFLVGCGHSTPSALLIDSEFTDAERALIRRAINDWVEVTDSDDAVIATAYTDMVEPFTIDQWKNRTGILFKIHEYDPGYQDMVWEVESEFPGVTQLRLQNMAVVMDYLPLPGLHKVLLHEFGHLYGLDHAADGVMRPGGCMCEESCITESDLDQFCEVNACGPAARSNCE